MIAVTYSLLQRYSLILLFLIGLFVRSLVWLFFGVDEPYLQENLFRSEEIQNIKILQEHFFSIIFYSHVKPVGQLTYDALIYYVSSPDQVYVTKFILASVFGALTPIFIFGFLRLFFGNFFICFVSCLLVSVSLISWEYWRFGNHYNHINIFLVSGFLFFVAIRMKRPSSLFDIFASIFASLLMAMFSVMMVVAPLTLFFGLSYRLKSILTVKFLYRLGLTFTLPAIVFLFIAGKNYVQFELFSSSSLGGENRSSFVYTAGVPVPTMVEMAKRNEFPKWWLWCLDRALQDKADNEIAYTAGFSRGCTGNTETREKLLKQILGYLQSEQLAELADIVAQDLKTLEEKPWLLNFGVSDATTRFSIEYAKVSGDMYNAFMKEDPVGYLRQLIRANYIFLLKGSVWLSSDEYEASLHPRPLWLKLLAYAMTPILVLGIIFSYFVLLMCAFRRRSLFNMMSKQSVYVVIAVSIFASISAFFLTSLHCCENSRLFMNIMPAYFLLGMIALYLNVKFMSAWLALRRAKMVREEKYYS